ncbi:hypothetical protein G7Z17_g11567 [Cylindrodendrum hubeiense]|uniref:Uncharacterized protein n=1 Tax=Cylindrodendrum hubeiense TaxID=595255 RepID=A0A9P5LB64_9HYPO|nr:hypothetical protein G7Z17_g11567 [Cylindrodendrum hubeiense]
MESRGAPFRAVTELARERETYRYSTSLLSTAVLNPHGCVFPNDTLTAADDTALTAFCQLGACQTRTPRSFISLFDESFQYIIAEATPTLPLVPNLRSEHRTDDLYHCGTAVPRSHGICESTLYEPEPSQSDVKNDPTELPLNLVHDLSADPRYANKVYCQPGVSRFYAAVPIRTNKGINIGVYCVVDPQPHDDWNDQHSQILRNISRAIMRYLEGNKARSAHRRSERMNRGIGSFIEEKATMSGWRLGPHAEAFEDNAKFEGALNAKQQKRQLQQDVLDDQNGHGNGMAAPHNGPSLSHNGRVDNKQPNPARPASPPPMPASHSTGCCADTATKSPKIHENSRQSALDFIFSRAANLIRESIEVEGCLFLDAAMGSFGALSSPNCSDNKDASSPYVSAYGDRSSSGSGSSSDDSKDSSSDQQAWPPCRVLSFSTSDKSSIDGEANSALHASVAEKFLATLLRRYPRGKIFFFGVNGELQSSDSSEEDQTGMPNSWNVTTPREGARRFPGPDPNAGRKKRRRNLWARHKEGQIILKIFPGARSVAFVPVWDTRRNRWFAGGFVYTNAPTRIFLTDAELSYLRAFGTLAMAECAKHEIVLDEKAKSDALSSLSHELRSPLHGIILGAELLSDTDMSVVQGDIAHTLETCGRTLSDTLDHLLDFSKINNFMATTKQQQKTAAGRGLRNGATKTIEAGMMSLSSIVRLDRLAEEVVESVYAGYNFQQLSISQFKNHRGGGHSDVTANHQLDKLRAEEVLGPAKLASGKLQMMFGDVSIFLIVDPTCDWVFHTQAGAIRRIIMNLFGNALKYTQRGIIKVVLSQSQPQKRARQEERLVTFTVTDTGTGISKDFLQNDLFKPFSQENHLAPGTGLGLSLVKKMTSQLRGHVSVHSRNGVGTTVNVTLPLVKAVPSPGENPSSLDDELLQLVNDLRGLRVCLLGFGDHNSDRDALGTNAADHDGNALIQAICRDWLHMEVVSPSQIESRTPDLVLLTEGALPLRYHSETLSRPPCVVVCANALVAYKHSTSSKQNNRAESVEFISQPIGPHKLAKILLLVFQRWTNMQTIGTPNGMDYQPTEFEFKAVPEPSPPLSESPSYNRQTTIPSLSSRSRDKWPPTPIATDESQSEFKKPRLSASITTTEYLLVDDNPINLKILSSYLKKLGQVYRTATNGEEAVAAYKQNPQGSQFIFLDVSMPVMDGFVASREIRAFEREKGLEPAFIVALTGLASADAQREAFGSGMDLFLTKPVQLKELRAILQSKGVCS